MYDKLSDKQILDMAMKYVCDALTGGKDAPKARARIIVLSDRSFQVYSSEWVDANTPLWLVDFYPSGGHVVFNKTGG